MTLQARVDHDDDYWPDYEAMMLKTYSWLCMKPRVVGHVSDLLMCMRQRVFQELDPQQPTYHQMNLYSSGKSIHECAQSLLASDRGRFEKEFLVYWKGLSGSVDVYDKRYNIPIELKTPRSLYKLKEPHQYNLEQLKTYMSILGATKGWIQYQYIVGKGVDYQHFKIRMTSKEHMEQLNMMLDRFEKLQVGMNAEEPALTPGVYDDPGMNWLCKDCPYREPCEEMR